MYVFTCTVQAVLIIISFLCLLSHSYAIFLPNLYPSVKLFAKVSRDAGDPLIITPYLKNDSISLAQNLSLVPMTEKIGLRSYSGFFTVDDKHDSNLFFWYFPPFSKKENSPVILWLQGGPGGSSLFGLFIELGPLIAKKDGFKIRKYHWALNNHLIFIDNPVGTGFSYTKHDNGYCNDEDCIGKGLYNSMKQFFTMFPELKNNEFFISGESYAGKYIPSLAMEIHRQNANTHSSKINLKGLAMGNAYCDPINQLGYGKYLYQHGLLDDNQLKLFEKYQNQVKIEIKKENWKVADILIDRLLDGSIANFSYFKAFTGFDYYYNFLLTKDTMDISVFQDLLDNDNVRRSVHVGGLPFNSGEKVQLHLINDMLKSVAPYISELLSHYRILFYNGQLDIIVAYPLTENLLRNLNFSSANEYKKAPRNIWRVGDEVAGYVKKAGNLTEVLVRNAGHMVPGDQPKWALDLITRFVCNTL